MRKWMLFAVLCTALGARSEDVSVGSMYAYPGASYGSPDALTLVNLNAPARRAGEITSVALEWRLSNSLKCAAAYKIRFYRKSAAGNVYTSFATRGPFQNTDGRLLVPISPAVTVAPGDVIGVVQIGATPCGGVITSYGGPALQTAYVRGDLDVFDLRSSDLLKGIAVNVRGAGNNTRAYVGTIVAAGSLRGSNGSSFKTSVHLTNPNPKTSTATELVFHPAGRAAAPADPSMSLILNPQTDKYFEDIVGAFGQSGLGSIDVYALGSAEPVVTVRVYDDQGLKGTSGFTEEFLTPDKALYNGVGMLAYTGGSRFRTNVGVRSLGNSSTVQFVFFTKDGQFYNAREKTVGANAFEQVSLASLFGVNLPETGSILVVLMAGSAPALVYSSTTDNVTNDSSVQFAQRFGQ